MSYADFDDIYQICCDWSILVINGDKMTLEKQILFRDEVTDAPFSQANRWWELAEKEIQNEKAKVLM